MEFDKSYGNVPKKFRDWILGLFIVFTVFLMFRVAIVNGDSMNPTLENKNLLIVDKMLYKFSKQPIKRGDILILKANIHGKNKVLVKRVIGLPNDKIEIKSNRLYINNKYIQENYIDSTDYRDVKETIVSQKSYFVLGDNRANSLDSRHNKLGCISEKNIVGKVKYSIGLKSFSNNIKELDLDGK